MPPRIKAPAVGVPQTREEFEVAAVRLGELIRESDRIALATADQIARIKLNAKTITEALTTDAKSLWRVVSAYAEAHRGELLIEGRKSASIAAGTIGWRIGRAKVAIPKEQEEEIIEILETANLDGLLRVTTEIDKTAILAAPELLPDGFKHLFVEGIEELFFKPLDAESELTQRVRAHAKEAA